MTTTTAHTSLLSPPLYIFLEPFISSSLPLNNDYSNLLAYCPHLTHDKLFDQCFSPFSHYMSHSMQNIQKKSYYTTPIVFLKPLDNIGC